MVDANLFSGLSNLFDERAKLQKTEVNKTRHQKELEEREAY